MVGQIRRAGLAKSAQTGVFPDIRSVTPELSQLDAVGVRGFALLGDPEQLMLATVKGAHRSRLLVPNAHIQDGEGVAFDGSQDLKRAAPVHSQGQHSAVL